MNIEEQYDKLYRYCYFRVRDQGAAEDLTQETFLRFLTQTSYREEGKELRYLYTIARNLCIDHYRRLPEESLEALAENGWEVTDVSHIGAQAVHGSPDAASPEDEILSRLLLRQALDALSAEDRELLLLRFVNEVPDRELCALYGISRFALYRRIRQARRRLAERLEAEGEIGPERRDGR